MQTDSEQRPHKVSFHVEKSDAPPIVEALGSRLRERGVSCQHVIIIMCSESSVVNTTLA